jgi:hypothetical protein
MQEDAVSGLHKASLSRTRSVRQHAALIIQVYHLTELSRGMNTRIYRCKPSSYEWILCTIWVISWGKMVFILLYFSPLFACYTQSLAKGNLIVQVVFPLSYPWARYPSLGVSTEQADEVSVLGNKKKGTLCIIPTHRASGNFARKC